MQCQHQARPQPPQPFPRRQAGHPVDAGCLLTSVLSLAEAEHLKEALEATDSLAKPAAKAGHVQEATELAEKFEVVEDRSRVLRWVAEATAVGGHVQQAQEVGELGLIVDHQQP